MCRNQLKKGMQHSGVLIERIKFAQQRRENRVAWILEREVPDEIPDEIPGEPEPDVVGANFEIRVAGEFNDADDFGSRVGIGVVEYGRVIGDERDIGSAVHITV